MSTVISTIESELTIAFQGNGNGIPLFLVGFGLEAVGLVRHLGSTHPIFGVRIPSLEMIPDTIPAPHRMEAIAATCARAVREQRPTGPYALAGWCATGFLALEIARQLEREGAVVAFVAMLDARTIHLPPMDRFKRVAIRGCYFLQRFQFLWSRTLRRGARLSEML